MIFTWEYQEWDFDMEYFIRINHKKMNTMTIVGVNSERTCPMDDYTLVKNPEGAKPLKGWSNRQTVEMHLRQYQEICKSVKVIEL